MGNEDVKEPPEVVILKMEKITDDLVEPETHLPRRSTFPHLGEKRGPGFRWFGQVFLHDRMGDSNSIFKGHLDGGCTIKGVEYYDDTDFTHLPLLKWSPDEPRTGQKLDE